MSNGAGFNPATQAAWAADANAKLQKTGTTWEDIINAVNANNINDAGDWQNKQIDLPGLGKFSVNYGDTGPSGYNGSNFEDNQHNGIVSIAHGGGNAGDQEGGRYQDTMVGYAPDAQGKIAPISYGINKSQGPLAAFLATIGTLGAASGLGAAAEGFSALPSGGMAATGSVAPWGATAPGLGSGLMGTSTADIGALMGTNGGAFELGSGLSGVTSADLASSLNGLDPSYYSNEGRNYPTPESTASSPINSNAPDLNASNSGLDFAQKLAKQLMTSRSTSGNNASTGMGSLTSPIQTGGAPMAGFMPAQNTGSTQYGAPSTSQIVTPQQNIPLMGYQPISQGVKRHQLSQALMSAVPQMMPQNGMQMTNLTKALG